MRVVIEIRKDAMGDVVLNNLFQQTQLQVTFGINMVALLDGQPKLLNLKDILEAFIRHRREVVTRRTIFELRKARARAHILEGLTVALANIDEMIELIKTSHRPAEARERMLARRVGAGHGRCAAVGHRRGCFAAGGHGPRDRPEDGRLPVVRSAGAGNPGDAPAPPDRPGAGKAVRRIPGMLETIVDLIEILEDPDQLLEVIRDELEAIKDEFGDARRTEIQHSQEDLNVLDLIAPEDVVVTLSHTGYIKRQPASMYRAQKRGGKGRSATAMKDEDFVERLWVANTHDTLLTFTSTGRVLLVEGYQMPDAGPGARGKPIVNLLPLEAGEKVQAVVPVREYSRKPLRVLRHRQGTVKKTPLTEFAFQLQKGKIAIKLDEGDALVDVELTDGNSDIMLFASNGKAVRFAERRSALDGPYRHRRARHAAGQGCAVVVADRRRREGDILTATERGYGKRTAACRIPAKGRGTQGVIAHPVLGAQRRTGRRRAGHRGARADADLQPGHAGAYPRGRSRSLAATRRALP